jgi:hypothetical protein
MYSSTPRLRPPTTSSSPARSVNITIGTVRVSSRPRSWRTTSNPSIFGITLSSTSAAGRSETASSIARSPSSASITS